MPSSSKYQDVQAYEMAEVVDLEAGDRDCGLSIWPSARQIVPLNLYAEDIPTRDETPKTDQLSIYLQLSIYENSDIQNLKCGRSKLMLGVTPSE